MGWRLNLLAGIALAVGLTIGSAAAAPASQPTPAASDTSVVAGLTPSAPDLTDREARMAFGQAMMICLATRAANQTFESAPSQFRSAFVLASDGDRQFLGSTIPANAPVWASVRLGHLLYIVEPSATRCEVRATQLSVDATFQTVISALHAALPDFRPVAVQPGFNPIAYQFESVRDGANYVLHMEGAEPGAPGHQLRFSLLLGWVERQSVAANDSATKSCRPNTAADACP